MAEIATVLGFCGTKHDPLMRIVRSRRFLDSPIEVVQEERDGSLDSGKVVVIEKYDAALGKQTAKIEQIKENEVEPVIPVDKREIERPPALQEGR